MQVLVSSAKASHIAWRMEKALLSERIKEARQHKLHLKGQVAQQTKTLQTLCDNRVSVVFLPQPVDWMFGQDGMATEYMRRSSRHRRGS